MIEVPDTVSQAYDEVDTDSIPLRVLVLDDDPGTTVMLAHMLGGQKWDVISAHSIREASSHLSATVPDVAVVDVFLGEEDGLTYVKSLRDRFPDMGIVVISGEDTQTLAGKAISSGADYFLSKPLAPAAVILTVRKLYELRHQRQRALYLENELKKRDRESLFPEILTLSDAMKSVLRLIEKVGSRDLSVLICGESGTGKELVAKAIHQASGRAPSKFVELNCAALPPNLVESELFGHEKGAFTGAVAARAGKIELADKGTLFLDEIGELPLEIQPKLLRALQEKRIVRVGGKRDIECDFRLVSATHRDLLQEVKNGNFREDLFYRVAVFPIKLPPLRDRREDLDLLLAHFLTQEDVKNPMITPAARDILRHYHWPGNIRELKNFAQAITLLSDKEIIDEPSVRQYFGSRLVDPPGGRHHQTPLPGVDPLAVGKRAIRKLADVEREEIVHALRTFQGSVPEAALALGMGRATLYKYLKRHGMSLSDFM